MAGKACHVVGSTTQVGLTQALGLMPISFPTLLEYDQFELPECECCGRLRRLATGVIHDQGGDLLTYEAIWTEGDNRHNGEFNLVFGAFGGNSLPSERVAVAISYNFIMRSASFLDARSRAFAQKLALHSQFPDYLNLPEELAHNSVEAVDFILGHDSRLSGLYESEA